MPRERSFPEVLAISAFAALAALYLIFAALFAAGGFSEMKLTILQMGLTGLAYMFAAYELYRGSRWGWIYSLVVTATNTALGLVYNAYPVAAINSLLFILVLLAARSHIRMPKIPKLARKPSIPPPSTPTATAFISSTSKQKRFVRRRH